MLGLGLGLDKSNTKVNYHMSIWDTTKTSTGSSNSDQIKLPSINGGSYNCTVYWGDGNSNNITTWNDANLTHTYTSTGIYNISIIGQFSGFQFNNAGDRLKLISIENGGKDFYVGESAGGNFYGCANFLYFNNLNTVGVINMTSFFRACSKLNCYLDINTSSCTNMYTMMYQATLLNQSISHFDIANVANMNLMLTSSGISNSNYSDALIAWNSKSHKNSVTLAASAKYEARAAAARVDFINNHSWTINDGGAA
ncbi:MAG: BspA family leucine-rich repeat surface protein [Calditrichaeota bacterium]|nr:MAG: BspA family leucine-rich repeat surface protein [Calditrichota bacterium]